MTSRRSRQEHRSRVQRKRGRRMQEILRPRRRSCSASAATRRSAWRTWPPRLDVTKGSLYYYFPSKDELGTAAIETLGNDWTARLERLPAAQDGPPVDRLRALIREHVTIAVRDYPAALRLFLVPQELAGAAAGPDQGAPPPARRRCSGAVVEEGVAAGEFTVTSVDTVLRCMHAAMSPGAGLVRAACTGRALDRGRRRAHRHPDDARRRAAGRPEELRSAPVQPSPPSQDCPPPYRDGAVLESTFEVDNGRGRPDPGGRLRWTWARRPPGCAP